MRSTEEILDEIIKSLSSISQIDSIGISGSKSPLPLVGEGDIDIFIYCDEIPNIDVRKGILEKIKDFVELKLNIFEGGNWGVGDFGLINKVETWLMFFTKSETMKNVEEILSGQFPDKVDNYYYPIGRLAMLKNMAILFDKNNFLKSLQESLEVYPEGLANILSNYHLQELDDVEDLERAVIRKDVLFYHFALDLTLDHLLQALFALNKEYFPSRKRSFEFIRKFIVKPNNCEERLLDVIKYGANPNELNKSYSILTNLITELKNLV